MSGGEESLPIEEPSFPSPPSELVCDAENDVPTFLSHLQPSVKSSVPAESLYAQLATKGHIRSASVWAVYNLVKRQIIGAERRAMNISSGGLDIVDDNSETLFTYNPRSEVTIDYQLCVWPLPAMWDWWTGHGLSNKIPGTKRTTKKGKSSRKTRNRKPRTVELLLVFLEDRRNANLNYSELARELEVHVSSISRAFKHKKYGPEITRKYYDHGVKPPKRHES